MPKIVVIRHGRTAWSHARRHTGRTDVPLDEVGLRRATDLRPVLADRRFGAVFCSPLQRARQTAVAAGLTVDACLDDLVEWDYGGYEGLTSAEIQARHGGPWDVFLDGVVPGDTPGETAARVGARCDHVLARCTPYLAAGDDVALVAHGHLLRVLAARWLGREAGFGGHLELDAAARGELSEHHGLRTLMSWNVPAPGGDPH